MITTANETMMTLTLDARLHRDHRRREGAAERRQEDAEGEGHPVHAGDVDAHARR